MAKLDGNYILPVEIMDYYNSGQELDRLTRGIGPLELARTRELIDRFFPPPPARVMDIGGGPGIYSVWLAESGYQVHLVDAVPLHVEQAILASQMQPEYPIASCEVGDARRLTFSDSSADAVLLNGPLYHLTEKEDRLAALCEARRVLRPGGVLLAIGITRFASTMVGLDRWWIDDSDFLEMIRRELTEGVHIPPPSWQGLFTTAFFHHPDELVEEVVEAGFIHQETLAVQGPGWIIPEFEEKWKQEEQRQAVLTVVRWLEREPTILGISPHLMVVGHRPK